MEIKIIFVSFMFLLFCGSSGAERQVFIPLTNGPCPLDQFRCLNDNCISRSQLCNSYRDCRDSSDENYCRSYNTCPQKYSFYKCKEGKCIPSVWKCDGVKDCPHQDDEANCGNLNNLKRQLSSAKTDTTKWLYNQLRKDVSRNRWGTHLRKISVALYFGDSAHLTSNPTRTEMAYELSVQLLSKFAFRKLKDVSTFDLASYTNALLVTCVDPRKFYSVNLVEELRSRADGQNYTNPYVLLTLCNAGEKITETDVEKLNESFWTAHREFWTETQAIAVMALACAGNQPNPSFDLTKIKDFTIELKKRQYRNGTVEDLKTTALVMQALFSSESEEDSENFDEEKALSQILSEQQADGSFGTIINTYYVLPVLSNKTLINISSDHCQPYVNDEDSVMEDLMNYAGPKMSVKYSLWIGSNRDVERTLKLRAPTNLSFYGIMEMARDLDPQFRFHYVVKNGKPYINAVSGKQDDPESGRFWFLYIVQASKPVPVLKSPADLFPKENDHLIMWYRSGSWIE